jgi:hypothetical protein
MDSADGEAANRAGDVPIMFHFDLRGASGIGLGQHRLAICHPAYQRLGHDSAFTSRRIAIARDSWGSRPCTQSATLDSTG